LPLRRSETLALAQLSASSGVIGVTVVAAVIRFASLDAQSFDIGELFTVRLVRMPLGEMVRGVVDTEGTPHLYYVLAWLYARLFGHGEIALRSLSALLGTVTVPMVYLAARTMAGHRSRSSRPRSPPSTRCSSLRRSPCGRMRWRSRSRRPRSCSSRRASRVPKAMRLDDGPPPSARDWRRTTPLYSSGFRRPCSWPVADPAGTRR
jgi:hypothetical protein